MLNEIQQIFLKILPSEAQITTITTTTTTTTNNNNNNNNNLDVHL